MIEFGPFADELTRIFLLGLAGFVLAMAITPIYTYFAYKYKWWKQPRTHSTTGETLKIIAKFRIKRTIPRMAGLIIIAAAAIVTILFNLERSQTWLPLAALFGGGLVGLIDDIVNISGRGGKVAGLQAPMKFAMITIVAAAASWFFYYKLGYSTIHVPYIGEVTLGWTIIPLFIFAVVSTGNAVNISDGMDGLAGGLLLTAYTTFGIIAALQGNYGIAAFCFTIAGTLLSYIWFNIPPARFVMGDVGSFSLGTSLGVVAMLTDTLILLPIIGFVFVLEGGSSLIQILSKRFFGRRIFIAAPIHHHFEAKDWPKTKVTMRFWVLGFICSLIGLVVAITGGF